MGLDLPAEWSIDEKAEWFRAYLRREIARRLRDEASFADGRVPIICAECGDLYGVSERSRRRLAANGATPRCESCRNPTPEPDERDRRWADERIGDLAAAVDALR